MRKIKEDMTFESNRKTVLGIVAEPLQPDCSGAVLSEEEIREAAEIYNSYFQNVLVEHRDSRGYLPDLNNLQDITSLDNWQYDFSDKISITNSFVTDQDTIIEGQKVASGSWLLELEILDEEIQEAIDQNLLNGLSYGGAGILASLNSHQQIMNLLPCEISLVKHPCNQKQWLRKAEVIRKPYPNEHACRLREPSQFQEDTFKRMTRESQGKEYSIVAARLKGKESLTEQAYRYNKDTWTESQARQHCTRHKGLTFEPAKEEK